MRRVLTRDAISRSNAIVVRRSSTIARTAYGGGLRSPGVVSPRLRAVTSAAVPAAAGGGGGARTGAARRHRKPHPGDPLSVRLPRRRVARIPIEREPVVGDLHTTVGARDRAELAGEPRRARSVAARRHERRPGGRAPSCALD